MHISRPRKYKRLKYNVIKELNKEDSNQAGKHERKITHFYNGYNHGEEIPNNRPKIGNGVGNTHRYAHSKRVVKSCDSEEKPLKESHQRTLQHHTSKINAETGFNFIEQAQ